MKTITVIRIWIHITFAFNNIVDTILREKRRKFIKVQLPVMVKEHVAPLAAESVKVYIT